MRKFFILLVALLCLSLAGPSAALDLDIDVDSNDAADIQYGGTNASTAAGARTNLGAAANTLSGSYVGTTNDTPEISDTLELAVGYNAANIADILSALGVSQGAVNMGAFTGTTIPDNQDTKDALQALETQLETIGGVAGDITGVLDVLSAGVITLRQAATDFASNDATPEITKLIYRCNYTVETTITDFDGTLYDGQLLIVYFDEDMTAKPIIDLTSSGIEAWNRASDYTTVGGEVFLFIYSTSDSQWHCLNIPDEITTISQTGLIRNDSGSASAAELSGAVSTSGSNVTSLSSTVVKDSNVDWGSGAGQVNMADVPGGVAGAYTFNFAGSEVVMPSAAGDASLTVTGQVKHDDADDAIAVHAGASGEVSGEVQVTLIPSRPIAFDPKAVSDGTVDVLFIGWVGDDAPNGVIIDEWKLSFTQDPTTELDADLCYADDFVSRGNETVVDALDTTAGVASEDVDSNINTNGAAIPNGKVLYIKINTAYTATGEQVSFQYWYHAEED